MRGLTKIFSYQHGVIHLIYLHFKAAGKFGDSKKLSIKKHFKILNWPF